MLHGANILTTCSVALASSGRGYDHADYAAYTTNATQDGTALFSHAALTWGLLGLPVVYIFFTILLRAADACRSKKDTKRGNNGGRTPPMCHDCSDLTKDNAPAATTAMQCVSASAGHWSLFSHASRAVATFGNFMTQSAACGPSTLPRAATHAPTTAKQYVSERVPTGKWLRF